MALMTRRGFLRAVAAAGAAQALQPRARAAARRPNIVLFLADDLGWADLGCYGNTFNETPRLDAMAAEGLRFTQAYAAAPVCSPTRASLMTGQYPARVGIMDYLRADDPNHLSPDKHVCLARPLAEAGYATGLIGKWHLMGDYAARRGAPGKHGFAEAMCSETKYIGGGDYFAPYNHLPEVAPRAEGEFLTDRLGLEAQDFIRRHAGEPFFLYVSFYSVHTALAAPKPLVEKYRAKPSAGKTNNNPVLAAMIERMDACVGGVLDALDELELTGDTLVLFMSDNGGEHKVTSNAPLRGAKSQLFEGGIREPLIARWPGRVPAGQTTDAVVSTIDFMPTLLEAAGAPLPENAALDGTSFLPVLEGRAQTGPRTLFWHYPLAKPHFLGGRSGGAVRRGDLKLIHFYDTDEVFLYDLASDLGETRNLAGERPGAAAELQALHAQWLASLGLKAP